MQALQPEQGPESGFQADGPVRGILVRGVPDLQQNRQLHRPAASLGEVSHEKLDEQIRKTGSGGINAVQGVQNRIGEIPLARGTTLPRRRPGVRVRRAGNAIVLENIQRLDEQTFAFAGLEHRSS